jgi:hypothetical protein
LGLDMKFITHGPMGIDLIWSYDILWYYGFLWK